MAILFENDSYTIDDDPSLLDVDVIHRFLVDESYWGQKRSYEQVVKAIEHSYNIGAYLPSGEQVGYVRVVTDFTTFAWICDVFVSQTMRGMGIGNQFMDCMVNHPELKNIRRMMLATRDAHGLYAQYGFKEEDELHKFMKRLGE